MTEPTFSHAERIAQLEADLAAERSALAQSRGELAMFYSMAETVPVGVIIADARGRIVHGNAEVAKMVRHEVHHSQDYESYGDWVSYHPDGRLVESHEYPLARILSEGIDEATLDVHYERGDGTRFWMRIIGERIIGEDGERLGAVVALVDIDDQVRLQNDQKLLIAELNHRVKNAFSVSQSIVARVLRTGGADPELALRIDERLKAYAAAHARLVGQDWVRVPLRGIAEDVLEPIAGDRVHYSGPELILPGRNGLAFSMAFYELATNSLKYGALSSEDGKVHLSWEPQARDDETVWQIRWAEEGGPPPVAERKPGFGSFITGRAIAMETRGSAETSFEPSGLVWELTMPKPYEPGT